MKKETLLRNIKNMRLKDAKDMLISVVEETEEEDIKERFSQFFEEQLVFVGLKKTVPKEMKVAAPQSDKKEEVKTEKKKIQEKPIAKPQPEKQKKTERDMPRPKLDNIKKDITEEIPEKYSDEDILNMLQEMENDEREE